MGNETKSGARHSAGDQQLIQEIHDHALKLGAVSPQPAEWVPVRTQIDGAPIESETLTATGGTLKAVGDRFEGLLVKFSTAADPDLQGDYFDAETDFGFTDGAVTPIYFNHRLPIKTRGGDEIRVKTKIGEGRLRTTAEGIMLEDAILFMRDEYEQAIARTARKGKLGLSSGTAAHLVDREMKGGAAHITSWQLGLDASVTPTPAEPRTYVRAAKALPELVFEFETDAQVSENAPQAEPQVNAETFTAQAASGAETKSGEQLPQTETAQVVTEENEMDEKQFESLAAKMDAQAAELAELKAKWSAPATNGAPGVVTMPAVKTVTERGFKDDEVKSFLYWIRTGDEAAYKAAMQGQTDSEGGYAVPDDFYNQVVAKRNEASVMRQAGAQVMQTSLDRLLVPVEDTAATKFVVTAEEGSYDENEPTLNQVAITVHKMTKLIKISEELEADAKANFGTYLSGVWGRTLGLAENYYFCNVAANGSSQPQSVTYASTATTAVASQTATTAAELLTLIYSVGSAYSNNLALLMRRTTLGAIRALTGNPFAFIPTPQGVGNANTFGGAAGTLHNVPVFLTDELPAQAAANKPIVVFNPDFYMIVEREGLTVSRNPWLYQATGQIGLFARARLGGALLQSVAAYHLLSKT